MTEAELLLKEILRTPTYFEGARAIDGVVVPYKTHMVPLALLQRTRDYLARRESEEIRNSLERQDARLRGLEPPYKGREE